MGTIHVTRVLRAPAEKVFDVLADHARYGDLPGVRSAELVRTGAPDPNGVGALRRVDVGLARFDEEITAFERPTLLAYKIVRSRPPVAHEGGEMRFRAVPDGVEVTWTSTLRVLVPIVGGIVTALAVRQMTRAFDAVLLAVEEKARTP